jgi:hypothetical protein
MVAEDSSKSKIKNRHSSIVNLSAGGTAAIWRRLAAFRVGQAAGAGRGC